VKFVIRSGFLECVGQLRLQVKSFQENPSRSEFIRIDTFSLFGGGGGGSIGFRSGLVEFSNCLTRLGLSKVSLVLWDTRIKTRKLCLVSIFFMFLRLCVTRFCCTSNRTKVRKNIRTPTFIFLNIPPKKGEGGGS
jgi:hypothetical protein